MTLEQERAADALAKMREIGRKGDSFKKKYRSYVDRLGPTIVMNGLGQAMAAEYAAVGGDGEEANVHRAVFENVEAWLCRDGGVYGPGKKLLDAITSGDESLYLRAQAEALAWLDWHKKFCRAEFPRGED